MADPNDPWAAFSPQAGPNLADTLNRPVFRRGVPPTPPTEQYHPMTPQERRDLGLGAGIPAVVSGTGKPEVIGGAGDKIDYRAMTPEEKRGAGLDEGQPFYIGSNGLPTLPQGAKGAAAPIDQAQARSHVSDMLNKIDEASNLLNQPLTTGLPGTIFGHVPGTNAYTFRSLVGDTNDPNNPGQITGDLRQQGIAMLRALNGGSGVGTVARSQQEQAALQTAMSNIRQGLPADQLKSALHDVGQIYRRAYARSFGMDPQSPDAQTKFGIDPLWQPPGGTPATKGADNGITASNPPPAIGVNGGQAAGVSAGDTEATTNPQLARIAPKLQQYLAADPKQVSNAMILGFMQKNGVNPAEVSIMPALQYRVSKDGATWRANGGGYSVDPTYNVPLHGFRKAAATVSGSTPGATVAGAADTATLGAVPDAAGIIHAVTGAGPTRAEAIQARDAIAGNSPTATLVGNFLGGFMPLSGVGEAGAVARAAKTAGAGGAYGFFGSDNPDIRERAFNGGLGAIIAGLTHGAVDAGTRGVAAGYRTAARPIQNFLSDPSAVADQYALGAAARKMPTQPLAEVNAANEASRAAGVPAPAAASLNRSGQDYIARIAAGSPAARAVADQVAQDTAQAIPHELAGDFNSAIAAANPGADHTAFLNRPVRDVASDVQSLASDEYEKGIAPIANERLTISDDLAQALSHERVRGAISDALSNSRMSDETRQTLRNLPRLLQEADAAAKPSSAPMGAKAAAQVADLQQQVRDQTLKSIPLSVDAGRNLATALDRTASRLQDGSEGGVELRRLSGQIRQAIGNEYPEFDPVNVRYASRQRAIEAMESARKGYMASTPDQIDALARSSRRYTDAPNEGRFNGAGVPSGAPLPSNRQFAGVGAREAASVAAGERGAATADRIANNVNQRTNNAMVLGQSGANAVQGRAAIRANIGQTVDRIASGSTRDQTEGWFNTVKTAAAAKLTGGSGHYLLAHAAGSIPGFSNKDAARVVRLYLDSDSSDQVLNSLAKAYGDRRARFIMGRMAAVTATASGVRGFPASSK